MACEDFPCCGHEPGCCPDFDPETGKQLNMKCTCGASVPINSTSSMCKGCINRMLREESNYGDFGDDDYGNPSSGELDDYGGY